MFAGVCKKSKRLFPTGIYSTFKPNVFAFVFFNELIQNIFRQGVVGAECNYIWEAFQDTDTHMPRQSHRIGVSVFILVLVKDYLSSMVKLCLLCLARVGAEPYIDRRLGITNGKHFLLSQILLPTQ